MKLKKRRLRVVRYFIGLVLLVLLYLCATVGYYFLPWSLRQSVYKLNPQLNKTLRVKGFRIVEGWDGLGLWGRDCRTIVESGCRDNHAFGGYPSDKKHLTYLENKSYVVGYSESLRNPLWVAYRVFDVPARKSGKRPGFRTDRRTRSKVSPRDYTHSGYDRGHMAPNYAISTRYGSDGQRETFLMSNIIPQTPRINRYLWKDLEMRVAKRYGLYFNEVWVLTGPVFEKTIHRLKSGVAIPSAYYKIVVDEKDGQLRATAFLIAADCPPYTRIKSRLVSIDQIEELTGLDFFPQLPLDNQIALEANPATRLWPWLGSALQYRFKSNTP